MKDNFVASMFPIQKVPAGRTAECVIYAGHMSDSYYMAFRDIAAYAEHSHILVG